MEKEKLVEIVNEFAEATFQVYHEMPACPVIGLALAVKDYTSEITVYPRDSSVNGWRGILAQLPCVDPMSTAKSLRKYQDVVMDPKIVYSSGEENISYLYARVLDGPLNFLMGNKIDAFTKLAEYRATAEHEEFLVIVYPPLFLDAVVEGLKKQATDLVFASKNLRPLREMTYKAPLKPPAFANLDEEDERLLMVAFQRGWFEYPRPREGRIRELARELGSSPAAVDVRLRSISRRLSQSYFSRHLYER